MFVTSNYERYIVCCRISDGWTRFMFKTMDDALDFIKARKEHDIRREYKIVKQTIAEEVVMEGGDK